jgi:8-oxo-dGTP diphosphatase
MQQYVCGFLFSRDREQVVLIRKNRPAWQAGKLNGVGGKVEAGETLHQAMSREFREEATMILAPEAWQHVITLTGKDWQGHFFRAFGDVDRVQAATDEPLEIHPTCQLPQDTIPNLQWTIPLLLDDDPCGGSYAVEVFGRPRAD